VVGRPGVETVTDVSLVLHPAIKVKSVARPRDPQRKIWGIDAPRPLADYGVHNNSINNLKRGLNERVFYTDNKCTRPRQCEKGRFSTLDVSDLRGFKIKPWTMEEVVNSYSGRQQERYRKAMESIYTEPLSSRDAKVATFLKAEKINFAVKKDPAPRVIQPRDPRFNICFAKFIKPMEPLIYKALGRLYRYPCVAKGFNAMQTGDIMHKKWMVFKDPVCVGLDASRFDQHVSVEALKFTHKIYRKFCNDPEFCRLLDMMYVNKGVGSCKDGRAYYKVQGCRMSGDMDTALGNCVLMVLMTYVLCKTLGIDHELMDNGDDCVVIFEREHELEFRAAVDSYYGSLGFTMKVEPTVDVLEQVEFCQTHPVFDGTSWRMVRNPVAIAKDMVSVIDWTSLPLWYRAIGDCGKSLTWGIPIFYAFYTWLSRCGVASNVDKHPLFRCGMVNLATGMSDKKIEVSPQARLSFCCAFGIEPDMQVAIEQMYLTLSTPALGKLSEFENQTNHPEWYAQAETTAYKCLTQTVEWVNEEGMEQRADDSPPVL